MARRSRPDLLAAANEPRWLTVRTVTGVLIEAHELPPHTDLHRAMADKATQLRAEGWEPETEVKYGVFFASRANERIEVSLASVPPGTPTAGPWLQS
jgi:hypothetical protein